MTTGMDAVRQSFGRPDGFPRHVAIIMDGNGRWARARGLPRVEGHRRGLQTLREIVRHAGDVGLECLTLYSFSSENWSRPAEEVRELMGLLKIFIRRDLAELDRAGVRVRVVGERAGLAADIAGLLDEAETTTAANTGLTLVVAFNYGARNEIARAVRALARDVAAGRLAPEAIDEAAIGRRLDTADMPDPDLIIRTSGEQRLSNFLLWQAAYSEFLFVPTYWPDFSAAEFDRAIDEYLGRERRFGGLKAGVGV
ncbi:ditrans,polycis-undecaprenyl-diphosphate synthase [Pleomorphomonas sp. SM30]|uniref:Isoprenyl transferase n=2 Tax=Oharaeibacter diazotrophicus TaxID=1920512 RepID=A0A4R6RNU2_9HYPH|nr:undecaprenyl diphosphate synthase [Oharaeibacter diazotrophicus]BBE70560.1 ditrans,polycis-undecaprenyl-diphosphate synthase [Pleomorphomonas sp. SM30]